jgi:ATPase subunit of ABC transporter with duplicated ATPase domains
LNAFEGSVLIVSHNQGFLSGFCKELWVLDDGQVTVSHSDTESFDELFSEYRRSILQGGKSLTTRRREKTGMARHAAQQRTGARQSTALL